MRAQVPMDRNLRLKKLRRAAFVCALAIYVAIVGANFDPSVTEAQRGVAGDQPFGIPTQIFFIGLHAILFFPIFWWTPQFVKLQDYADHKETNLGEVILSTLSSGFGLFFLLTSVEDGTPKGVKTARNIVVIGFLYFIVLAGIWMYLATRAGV